MTTIDRLVHMANQIAANLTHDPDPVATMANHIALFWDPRMKAMITAHDGSGLTPAAAAAIAQLSASL
jgi:formate dehydrogenase subunit delta